MEYEQQQIQYILYQPNPDSEYITYWLDANLLSSNKIKHSKFLEWVKSITSDLVGQDNYSKMFNDISRSLITFNYFLIDLTSIACRGISAGSFHEDPIMTLRTLKNAEECKKSNPFNDRDKEFDKFGRIYDNLLDRIK